MPVADNAYAIFRKFAAVVVASTTDGADVLLYLVRGLSLEVLGNRYSERFLV
jgi:hypothetical protein